MAKSARSELKIYKPARPPRFSAELIEEARETYQPYTDRVLSEEDGRQILENLVGFFTVLHEVDRAAAKRIDQPPEDADSP